MEFDRLNYVTQIADPVYADVFQVLEYGTLGNPIAVRAVELELRGSYLEARFNAGLALFNLRIHLWRSLPLIVRAWIPAPAPIWRGPWAEVRA